MCLFVLSLALLLAAGFTNHSIAAVRQFGKETQKSPLWAGALDKLVNSPERVAGQSSFGKTEFHFNGDTRAINRLIARYGKLDQPHVYLSVGDNEYRASLQIQHYGDRRNYLTVYVRDPAELKALKLPNGLAVEAMPPVSESLDMQKKAEETALSDQIVSVVKQHAQSRKEPEKKR